MDKKGYSRTPDAEDRKKYQKMQDARRVVVRLTAKERTLLESMMRRDEWQSTSGYIRYKLFGLDPERRAYEMVKQADPDDLVTLLKNTVLDIAGYFEYYSARYDKDMSQLWREEGVDLKAWTRATNRWHSEMAKRLEDALATIRQIALVLGLEEYGRMPSDYMDIDPDDPSKEKRDKLAAQLRKEQIAMGRIDNL